MTKLLFCIAAVLGAGVALAQRHKIDYRQSKVVAVAALTNDTAGGTVIPNGEKVGIARVDINGADPTVYAMVVWDYGGGAEKIFISTVQRADVSFDVSDPYYQVIGDGVKAIKVVILNNTLTLSPIIGGTVEMVKL